jgi:uncharacterized protein with GYD domain
MQTFVMATRLAPGALSSPATLEALERKAVDAVKTACPEVRWTASYALLGPYDYIDVFEAPDNDTATRVATLIRTFGHAHTEIWGATSWDRFREILSELPREG